ncbi:glycerate kinase family protein [Pectinatus sottacetonis]|uniref:glycerate kinase family protein n=1 Tax=Pectinatus sottacetonis TaxID=1002795 RepID=UPI0018C52145|nr:glycerate kinase [Pectinatus sottacetonis]
MPGRKKFIVIPDSFKGTLSSYEICAIMSKKITAYFPCANIVTIPIADGGEGTTDAFIAALGGQKIITEVNGPYQKRITSFFGILPDKTAVIEMAAAAGLPLVKDNLHVEYASTFGVGQLIKKAVDCGCKKIILGLGGSCTNDGGCGMAAALGGIFKDIAGNAFLPVGNTLKDIATINLSSIKSNYSNIKFYAMCDIDNKLYGKNGAAFIFAPQKGADDATVELLDKGLMHLSSVIKASLGMDIADLKGGGAAGGMGAGVAAFLNGSLSSGINTILDCVNFDKICRDTDFIFSGEGKLDHQSLQGKVLDGICQHARQFSVPVIAVVGAVEGDISEMYNRGITAIFSINQNPLPFSQSAPLTAKNLQITMDNILRLLICSAK